MQQLLSQVLNIAKGAGAAIMDIYQTDYHKTEKSDASPLTAADLAAHHFICQQLAQLSHLPILSEESAHIPWSERQSWDKYWLIDPLDGTKEFIKGNGEFTVNIALIEHGKAVLGVVYAPALKEGYFAAVACGAFKQVGDNKAMAIKVAERPTSRSGWRIVGSRSHGSDEMALFLKAFDQPKLCALGSSLKLCQVATAQADLYPRLGLTSEWDTAAAQCIVEQAGGQVLDLKLKPLHYNQKDELLHPYFIVCAAPALIWSPYLSAVTPIVLSK